MGRCSLITGALDCRQSLVPLPLRCISWCQRLAQSTCSERQRDDMVYRVVSFQEERGKKQMRGKRKRNRGPSSRDRGVDQAYDEGATFNPHLKAAILEVVENQLRDGDPPETRQTLQRLLAAGYSRKQATEMIGSAVVEEIWAVLHDHKPFDRGRFTALLEQLG